MNILLIGGGGREHALAWKLAQSPKVEKIYAAPGNPGMALLPKCECIALDVENLEGVADYAEEKSIDLTVVGPEAPLVAGLADVCKRRGLPVFGPSKAAAQLEGSKAFSKELMAKYNIPTAFFKICEDIETAKAYVEEKGAPIVVKADGLAAGKGVVVAMTKQEALDAIDEMMADHKFGNAGARLVLEEYMEGEEASLLAFTDGKTIVPMIASQDHKRVFDGDEGPNTGGMGTYAPAPVMTDVLRLKATELILKPVIAAMAAEGMPYQGCLYAGLMIKGDSVKVVEFNCRFGDPETEAVLPLFDGDLARVMLDCVHGTLSDEAVVWKKACAVDVVLASEGYPASHSSGEVISGIEDAKKAGCLVFHAGTVKKNGQYVVNGGRVLNVVALADTLAEAKAKAYEGVSRISWRGMQCRHDIADKGLLHLETKK